VPVPAKEGKNAQADLKSACMELGICNPQPSPPRESCGSGDPPLTSDGLQIRQSKGMKKSRAGTMVGTGTP